MKGNANFLINLTNSLINHVSKPSFYTGLSWAILLIKIVIIPLRIGNIYSLSPIGHAINWVPDPGKVRMFGGSSRNVRK